LAQPN